jgi:hypothetical protein
MCEEVQAGIFYDDVRHYENVCYALPSGSWLVRELDMGMQHQ